MPNAAFARLSLLLSIVATDVFEKDTNLSFQNNLEMVHKNTDNRNTRKLFPKLNIYDNTHSIYYKISRPK